MQNRTINVRLLSRAQVEALSPVPDDLIEVVASGLAGVADGADVVALGRETDGSSRVGRRGGEYPAIPGLADVRPDPRESTSGG